jgi:hypothetical protein
MRANLVLLTLFLVAGNLQSQTTPAYPFWQAKPALHQLDDKYKDQPAVMVEDNRSIDYRDDANDNLVQYKTLHRIIHVTNDLGIESFNKVYLPGGPANKAMAFRARTILPGGKIVNVDSSELKAYTDEDGDQYNIFAIPGLVKGSEIEYYYTWQRDDASLFGIEVVQNRIPVQQSTVTISSPARLIFEGKSFNGNSTPENREDTALRWSVFRFNGLTPSEEEKYSSLRAQQLRLEYKLSYNTAKGKGVRLFTWNELARRVHYNYTNLSDKERKKAADLADQLKLGKMSGTAEKIIALEHYVKRNIMVRKDLTDESRAQVDMILKNRMGSELGVMRLYGGVLDYLNIPYQFVLVGDRTVYEMDKAFENWNNADNPLIFVSETGKYLAPTRPDFRYPWIAPEWSMTLGMHMKATALGDVKTAIADMRMVPLEDYSQSASNMEALIRIDPSKDSLRADVKQIYKGYSASPYRAAFNFASADEQKEMLKEMVKFGTNSEHILSSNLSNREFDGFNENKPFVLEASVRANELMEKAGNKILLKLGEIIGPQVELYQEKQRVFPVDIVYPHELARTIRVEIPKGYTVKNPEAVDIRQVYPASGTPEMQFVSSHRMEGSTLVVSIVEEYRKTQYPLTVFEEFRKVINASADFNKVVLILEPAKAP